MRSLSVPTGCARIARHDWARKRGHRAHLGARAGARVGPPQPRVPASDGERLRTDLSRALVPLDEIISGGPPPDGIPAIDRPAFASTGAADAWLNAREPVLAL